jgi:hypothetical protein
MPIQEIINQLQQGKKKIDIVEELSYEDIKTLTDELDKNFTVIKINFTKKISVNLKCKIQQRLRDIAERQKQWINAARLGNISEITSMITNTSFTDPRYDLGGIALYQASANGHLEIVNLLLEKSVTVTSVCQGLTPYLIAKKNHHQAVAERLKEISIHGEGRLDSIQLACLKSYLQHLRFCITQKYFTLYWSKGGKLINSIPGSPLAPRGVAEIHDCLVRLQDSVDFNEWFLAFKQASQIAENRLLLHGNGRCPRTLRFYNAWKNFGKSLQFNPGTWLTELENELPQFNDLLSYRESQQQTTSAWPEPPFLLKINDSDQMLEVRRKTLLAELKIFPLHREVFFLIERQLNQDLGFSFYYSSPSHYVPRHRRTFQEHGLAIGLKSATVTPFFGSMFSGGEALKAGLEYTAQTVDLSEFVKEFVPEDVKDNFQSSFRFFTGGARQRIKRMTHYASSISDVEERAFEIARLVITVYWDIISRFPSLPEEPTLDVSAGPSASLLRNVDNSPVMREQLRPIGTAYARSKANQSHSKDASTFSTAIVKIILRALKDGGKDGNELLYDSLDNTLLLLAITAAAGISNYSSVNIRANINSNHIIRVRVKELLQKSGLKLTKDGQTFLLNTAQDSIMEGTIPLYGYRHVNVDQARHLVATWKFLPAQEWFCSNSEYSVKDLLKATPTSTEEPSSSNFPSSPPLIDITTDNESDNDDDDKNLLTSAMPSSSSSDETLLSGPRMR